MSNCVKDYFCSQLHKGLDLFLYRPPPRSQMLDRTGSAPETGEAPEGHPHPQEVLADVDAAEVDDLVACFKR